MKKTNPLLEEINRAKQLFGYDLSKTLNEQTTGTWPGFSNWADNMHDIINTHQNPCNFLEKRYTTLLAKLNALGGGTGEPSTSAGEQHAVMLTLKLQYFASWIETGCSSGIAQCCGVSTPITEQRGVKGLPPIPQWALALVDKGDLARAKSAAVASVQKYIAANPQDTKSTLQEEFNFPSWVVGQYTLLDGNPFTGGDGHPNPCKYLNNRIDFQTNKLNNLGGGTGNPSTSAGEQHAAMLNQKISWWQGQQTNRDCGYDYR